MRENTKQKNSEQGHFSRIAFLCESAKVHTFFSIPYLTSMYITNPYNKLLSLTEIADLNP